MLHYLKVLLLLVASLTVLTNCQLHAQTKDSSKQEPSFQEWKHSGTIWLMTTPESANLPDAASLVDFPVLVRLNKEFFDFAQAQPSGEDIRFSLSDGRELDYQIENWDSVQGTAVIWVRLPKISGNNRQPIFIHWGNPTAAKRSDGGRVFNASNGYQCVLHMNSLLEDEVGQLTIRDSGTASKPGRIGLARHFQEGKGILGGEMITTLPTGSDSHSTEAWFRADQPNGRIVGWGNEQKQGKVVMHYRSPPHIKMDCYFSAADVTGESPVPLSTWHHVIHTYEKGETRFYIDGSLDGVNRSQSAPLAINSPSRFYVGGWYNRYDFVGDIDEVRISNVVRSPEWIRIQYENQKAQQTLVGPIVQPGSEFLVSHDRLVLDEGQTVTVSGKAGGAQSTLWILERDGKSAIVETNRFTYQFEAGRISEDLNAKLTFKAIYANEVKSKEIEVVIRERIPEPQFTLEAPMNWDGRQVIEVSPRFQNTANGAGPIQVRYALDGVAVTKNTIGEKLVLLRSQGSGSLRVTATIDNGGPKVVQSVSIAVQEPPSDQVEWIARPLSGNEFPDDGQFIARAASRDSEIGTGDLHYAGQLKDEADEVFLRVFADDQLFASVTHPLGKDRKTYSFSVKLEARLVRYRTEFGSKLGNREQLLHTASNILCGDAFLINGQSNAVATDFGKEDSTTPSPWVRTFGSTDSGPQGSRTRLWGDAKARGERGISAVGFWGLELGKRLVETEKIPVCLINGAVGGTRIDQHQRNGEDPTDVNTIYGRLLWRVQQAKLTHGIRAVIWHQGENDQGADGPTGAYGYETYQQLFVDLSGAWKEDFPNIERYYAFQIWPKSCAMGIKGSDNRLREVQRTLPNLFSNLTVISTLGVKPIGGCHFPAEGYAQFASLLHPVMQQQLYGRSFQKPVGSANLRSARFLTPQREALVLEFDQPMAWPSDTRLLTQFYLDGRTGQIESGMAEGSRIVLKLKKPSDARLITYLDSSNWSPDNLLYGENGIAALTFCDVPISQGTGGK